MSTAKHDVELLLNKRSLRFFRALRVLELAFQTEDVNRAKPSLE